MEVHKKILESLPDLDARWKLARISAIMKVKPIDNEDLFLSSLSSYEKEDFENVLKGVFLNSRKLGVSYQRYTQITWERSDFKKYFQFLKSPCLQGNWESKKNGDALVRNGCSEGKSYGSLYCQYWREALDGLVLGLSDDAGYARHSAITSGDKTCLDVFYEDQKHLTDAIWSNEHRWGELPSEIIPQLDDMKLEFQKLGIELDFLGVKESELYYKLESKKHLICGATGNIYRHMLEKKTSEFLPNLKLKDASPVAVYGERS